MKVVGLDSATDAAEGPRNGRDRDGNFARTAGFAVPPAGAGMKTTGVVRCHQPRALDFGGRSGRRLESVPDAIMQEVLARVATIFE
jgi:mRNA-degrading endonuclease toxin of MazEF toxin-antitoxin module